MDVTLVSNRTEAGSGTKRSPVGVGALLEALRAGPAVVAEELGVDRHGLTLTMKLRVAPGDVDPQQALLLLGFVVDKLGTAYEEIDRLRGVENEGL